MNLFEIPTEPRQSNNNFSTTGALVTSLKQNGQDHEYYPTTTEIINIIKRDLRGDFSLRNDDHITANILDCGAGDGKVLKELTSGSKYAIEKSQILINQMDNDIFVVGCDFWENSLIDKKMDVVFSNPPYSEYAEWAIKIITEANCRYVYLVLPERWKDNQKILAAVEDREAKFQIIGSADFLEADRKARAKVDIIKVKLSSYDRYSRSGSSPDIDPFRLWVEKEFPLNERKKDRPNYSAEEFSKQVNELVPGRGLAPVLVELYLQEMETLQNNFRAISNLDREIFTELNVDFNSIMEFLRSRISNLKSKYWQELFSHFKPITSRLTKASRESLLHTLTENTSVDFNESNIYAVTTWAIKNANDFFDIQLVKVFEGLVKRANLVAYKSNQQTWGNDEWRFNDDVRAGRVSKYGLDYRCVISCYNTFNPSSYGDYEYPNGLHRNVHDRINDIITVANNLGFSLPDWINSYYFEWEPGKTVDFVINRFDKNILMSVKAYKNGNIHFKFKQEFLKSLNIEFGRLKGWLRSGKEAAEELQDVSEKEATEFFGTNFALDCSSVKLLAG